MNDDSIADLERIALELVTQGVHPQFSRNSAGWDCTLWCGIGWRGSLPIGHGGTAMAAMAAAVIERNEILAKRQGKAG